MASHLHYSFYLYTSERLLPNQVMDSRGPLGVVVVCVGLFVVL